MTITYIGKSGVLNKHLRDLLSEDVTMLVSARDYSVFDALQNDTIVWGGRYLLGDILERAKENKFLYVSTFVYNDFCDNYQIKKFSDSVRTEQAKGYSLNIPFISEFHNNILENLKTQDDSNYFTYSTTLNDISDSIKLFDKQGVINLEKARVSLKLNKRERLLWAMFSLLYMKKNTFRPSIFKLVYLNAVKIFEKVLHKLMFTHGLSAVYIKKEV